MAVDLKELERRIDETLGKETPESLTKWLNEQREKEIKEQEQCNIAGVIIRCPLCKSENIADNSRYEDNGIIGSGFRRWKTSDNRCCNDCGMIFIPTKGNGL